jgi:hypothetical protein
VFKPDALCQIYIREHQNDVRRPFELQGSESEQPTRPVDLRDDGVDIDLPSRKEEVLKYLKNNKGAS